MFSELKLNCSEDEGEKVEKWRGVVHKEVVFVVLGVLLSVSGGVREREETEEK